MTEKMKLQIYIPETLNTKLRSFIALKYKTFEKGLLSHEVELAVGHWLALHTYTQDDSVKAPNPLPKVALGYMAFKEFLLSRFYESIIPGMVIPNKHFRLGIQNAHGSDPRTVKKWTRTFLDNGLVKRLSLTQWELVA